MTKPAAVSTTSKSTPTRGKPTHYSADIQSLSPENNIGILLKHVLGSFNRVIDQHVSPLGLTAMQWRPLVMVHHLNIDTPAELSRHSHVDTGAMTRTLDRLEAKNFITRQRCADDRRVVRIKLTETGIQVAEQILPVVALSLNTHLQGFSKTEIHTLIDMLHRMLANGSSGQTDPAP